MESLYTQLTQAGCPTDHHESDLYVKDSPEARQVIANYQAQGGITNQSRFISQIDKEWWIELPFHFAPFWEAKATKLAVEGDQP